MQIAELLKLLNEKHVNYAIIGAYACAAHGFVRATSDLDILIETSPDNIKRVKEALEAFGYDTTDASVEDFQTKKILFRQYWLDMDVHPFAKGVHTDEVLKNKISAICEQIPTFFASLRHLIDMKKAAGRPKDKEDLQYLEEIERQKKSGNVKSE